MKVIRGVPVLLFFFLAGLVYSCATTGMDRSEKTTTSMENVEQELKSLSEQVNATQSSLTNVMNADTEGLREAFKVYSRNVDRLENTAEDFADESENMEDRGNEYFSEWQKEGETYQNPELREASARRRRELSDAFDRISENSTVVSRELQTFLTDVKEIQSYLSTDLSPQGVNAVAPLNKEVKENGQRLNRAIQRMQSSITNAQREMGTVNR